MTVRTAGFGLTPDGQAVSLYTCENHHGLSIELLNLGATVKSVAVPDRHGHFADVALGFSTLNGYLQRHPYFGSTVGRFANRIAGARFELDGTVHRLVANDGPNHLHGGEVGFDRALWAAEPFETHDESGVRFGYLSRDGEDRYPGNLQVEAFYALNDDNELRMSFSATTDAATPVNLTNHTYWNLAGGGNVLEHELSVAADRYLPADEQHIPTGLIAPVDATPMDFTDPKALGRDIDDVAGLGYDHSFVLRHRSAIAPAARLFDPGSGRVMEVATSQPGLHLYTGNNLSGFEPHGGFRRFAGVCLETQHFPDSPNRPQFPTTVLAPGEQYAQMTIHRFSVEN
jgi:aldose 1-epimerase